MIRGTATLATLVAVVALVAGPARAAMFASPEAQADMITELPGLPDDVAFEQYSGYLDLPGTQKHIHYWFVTAETDDPMSAPLAFWTNGGPGCSGLIGLATEQGPWRPQEDGSLVVNDYRWNLVANMVFIESPAGVGFSYSDDSSDYRIGDEQTAEDNYATIQAFLDRYPELRSNDLYITSESYGGHYMPTLANTIVEKNADSSNTQLNFKGFAVGNPYTDAHSNDVAAYETFNGHQLVSSITFQEYADACLGETVEQTRCTKAEVQLNAEVGNGINPYALDYPVCLDDLNAQARPGRAQRHWLLSHTKSPEVLEAIGMPNGAEDYEPCTDNFAIAYFNDREVKDAIHVLDSIVWSECSYQLSWEYADEAVPMMPLYQKLLNADNDLKILVYSGDDDSVCATSGTQYWIYDLGFDVSSLWNVWKIEGQTGGYATQFDVPHTNQFGFATVHGAGHEVPTYEPEAALKLFTDYINGDVFQW